MSENPVNSASEETGGLDQSGGSKEGPFINRRGVQAEEPGDGLGESESQPGQREESVGRS